MSGLSKQLLVGKPLNCIQTALAYVGSGWSVAEAVGTYNDSCITENETVDYESTPCKQAILGVTQEALEAVGQVMDFPTDCLGYTCAKKDTGEFENPTVRDVTLFTGVLEIVAAIVGLAKSSLTLVIQCRWLEPPGSTLGLDVPTAWHPALASGFPMLKDVREAVQAMVAAQTGALGDRDQTFSAAEAVFQVLAQGAGTFQTVYEKEMDDDYNESSTSESANAACRSGHAHMVKVVLGWAAAVFKTLACAVGEGELYQSERVVERAEQLGRRVQGFFTPGDDGFDDLALPQEPGAGDRPGPIEDAPLEGPGSLETQIQGAKDLRFGPRAPFEAPPVDESGPEDDWPHRPRMLSAQFKRVPPVITPDDIAVGPKEDRPHGPKMPSAQFKQAPPVVKPNDVVGPKESPHWHHQPLPAPMAAFH